MARISRRRLLVSVGVAAAACGLRTDLATPVPSAVRTPLGTAPNEPTPTRSGTPTATVPSPAQRTESLQCRAAWGAGPALEGGTPHTLRRMTVHHSALRLDDDAEMAAHLRQHQEFHQDAGWVDIAYHVAVDRHGRLYELRSTDLAGDTFTAYDPTGHLLILAEGHFDQQSPTDDQLEGIAVALAWGATDFDLSLETVRAHRDFDPTTSCPGDHLYSQMAGVVTRAKELTELGLKVVSDC